MKIRAFFTLCFVVFTSFLYAQNISKDEQPKQIKEKAEEFIFDGKFDDALGLYKNLLKQQPDDYDLNFKVGFCLLNASKRRYEAVGYLEKAVELYNKTIKSTVPFFAAEYYLARAYQVNYDFDKAIEVYRQMKRPILKKRVVRQIDSQIARCEEGRNLFNNPSDLIVTKLGVVNSNYSDHSPVVSADESVIIFTSKRKGNTGGLKTENDEYFEDIYIYDKRKGIHAQPENLVSPVNTAGHEADCGLSVDGQELYIYKSTKNDEGDICYSKLTGDKWSIPEKLNKNINSKKREVHASPSADGKYLYYSSNRRGSKGGMDIWVSEKTKDGTWGKSRNLGSQINTSLDEEGPYIHPDGKTLYFSSEGHSGMGGFDVFYSVKQNDGTWSEPKNLGFPLNTVDNDVFYIPSANGKRGYYSLQSGGQSNIYIANLYTQDEKNLTLVSGIVEDGKISNQTFDKDLCVISHDTVITPNNRVFVDKKYYYAGDSVICSICDINVESVDVYDSIYTVPAESKIFVIDADTKQLEDSYSPNILTGKYLFVLNDRKNYKVYYESENHLFDTKDISLKGDSGFKHIYHIAQLDTMITGHVRKSRTVSFAPKKVEMDNFTELEMDLLADFLKKYPNLKVDISAYDYLTLKLDTVYYPKNFKYGSQRENIMINYLISKGVERSRIYNDLSEHSIVNDSVEYTIYDENTLAQAFKNREERTKFYEEALVAAKKEQEEILKDFGLLAGTDTLTVEVCDILFEIRQYETKKYEENMKILANYMKDNPDAQIEIGGYTDLLGSLDYNRQLAQKRAQFVKIKLLSEGVRENQIIIKNYNIANPIAHNKTKNGEFLWNALPYNRRVEIKVLKQGAVQKLYVKTIEVPEKYSIDSENQNTNPIFSINILTSSMSVDKSIFQKLKNVKEHKSSDGTYIYYTGDYKTEADAQKDLQNIQKNYPKAIIFIKEF